MCHRFGVAERLREQFEREFNVEFVRGIDERFNLQIMRDELLSGGNRQEHEANRRRLWMRQLPIVSDGE